MKVQDKILIRKALALALLEVTNPNFSYVNGDGLKAERAIEKALALFDKCPKCKYVYPKGNAYHHCKC